MEALVQRLVQNPHDQDAIFRAHSAGQQDPRSYAMLLEKVGTATVDPALACHWLTEAANVWVISLNDAHRAARALMIAIDRDPTQPAPAERLAELYREKGDTKALAALLERRAKSLSPLAQRDPALRAQVAAIHEELGRLWAEPPLSNPAKAIENYRRAIEQDPTSQYSIYAVREALKAAGQVADAVAYYAMEQALVDDPERKVSLYADEADARRSIGDVAGALAALDAARRIDPNDATLKQQLATVVLDHVREGRSIDEGWKGIAADLFVELAEQYPGEHALAYSMCAAEILPAHDRGIQLAIFYGGELGRLAEVAPLAGAYLRANPNGPLAEEARRVAGDQAKQPSRPPRAVASAQSGEQPQQAAAPRRAPVQDRTIDDVESESAEQAVRKIASQTDAARAPAAREQRAPSPPAEEPPASGNVEALIQKASQLAAKNRKNEAAAAYREALGLEPTHPEAIAFLQTHLRQARKYGDLRDTLLRAARSEQASTDDRLSWLREVATICESQLRDFETAIQSYKDILELDPADLQVREQLRRLLERANRWDDLTAILERDAEQESDTEARIALEKQIAKLHEVKRKDPAAAGAAWARIAALASEDDSAITTAVKFFDKAERPDLAAQVIADNVARIGDDVSKAVLYKRLGALRQTAGELVSAGDAFSEAARLGRDVHSWEAAELAYAAAEAWAQAAAAASERAASAANGKQRAGLLAIEADYLKRGGDAEGAIARLEHAVEADPTDDGVAEMLERELTAAERVPEVATLLLQRAAAHPDAGARVALRKRAAKIQKETLGDAEGARASLALVLEDGADPEALSFLAEDAEERGEFGEAAEYLSRLSRSVKSPKERAPIVLRQARLLAEGAGDIDAAIEQYTEVLESLDKRSEEALAAIANLEEQRGKYDAAAKALEKHLTIAGDEAKVPIAARLADLYEGRLDDARGALRALTIVHHADPDDFDAVQRMVALAERLEDWGTMAEHLARLVEVEGDEEEVSRMTRELAMILSEKLSRGDDALSALAQIADHGDAACREAYVELGDQLGKKELVATKLVEWHGQSPPSKNRDDQLHAAFDRLAEVGAHEQAAAVAKELARMRVARRVIAEQLEAVAVRLKDLDALAIAHDLTVRELSGPSRAEEMVRQAEVLVSAGVDPGEAVQHGEQALTSVPPEEVGPLLERLSRIVEAPGHVIDLYERQVGRCKAPADRMAALSRAAQIAADRDALDRARGFLDLAISLAASDDALDSLEDAARASDRPRDSTTLRAILAEALSTGGQGARDGGRTRAALLRRAALIAQRELGETDRAFTWFGDALVAHVDDTGLDGLVDLAKEVSDPRRAETVLARALQEVFDGPLVRKLLARRAEIRAELLDDKRGSAEDLKRLHELAPSDMDVMERLSALYTELEDYRGMVQLYEDQILRGRDPAQRAELAREVARLWEERLADPREAADAWRRVLRMKAGDPEATAGLERAKSNMLKKPAVEAQEAPQEEAAPAPSEDATGAMDAPGDDTGMEEMLPAQGGAGTSGLEAATVPGGPEFPPDFPEEPSDGPRRFEGSTMPWGPEGLPLGDEPPSVPLETSAESPRVPPSVPPLRSAPPPPPPMVPRGASTPPPPPGRFSSKPPQSSRGASVPPPPMPRSVPPPPMPRGSSVPPPPLPAPAVAGGDDLDVDVDVDEDEIF